MPPDLLTDFHLVGGCAFGQCFMQHDVRGSFGKFVDASFFAREPHESVREVFFNQSMRGVVRGFHLQWPPADHAKAIACVTGRFFDVLLDLRRGSRTYGRFAAQTMGPGQFAYIPRGIAHAFQSLEDHSTMLYATTSAHVPALDGGVDPLSCGIEWPVTDIIVSDRDRALPPLDAIESPFA